MAETVALGESDWIETDAALANASGVNNMPNPTRLIKKRRVVFICRYCTSVVILGKAAFLVQSHDEDRASCKL